MKDFYKILGVGESATDDEIKTAYKKLAKQHHPDKNPGNKASEERFKEMSEAYNTLGDVKKRKEYDTMRRFGGRGGYSQQTSEFDMNDFMRNFGFGGGARGFGNKGGSFADIFDDFFEAGGQSRHSENQVDLSIPFQKAILGGDVDFTVRVGSVRTIRVKVPAGIQDGETLRIQNPDIGSLLVTIRIQPDPVFTRKGNDIYIDVPVNFAQLVLGSSARVSTVYDGKVDVKIPAGAQSGTMLKLGGLGVKSGRGTGDMYVTLSLVVPKNLSKKQRELFEEFARATEMKW